MPINATSTFVASRNLDMLIRSVLVPKVAAATRVACEIVLDAAKGLVPVDSGELRDSGHIVIGEERNAQGFFTGGVIGSVIFDAPHAGFVEFGTGIRGRGSYPWTLPGSGIPITGRWVYDYKNQDWIGHAAQPYLRPALDQSTSAILGAFRSRLAA